MMRRPSGAVYIMLLPTSNPQKYAMVFPGGYHDDKRHFLCPIHDDMRLDGRPVKMVQPSAKEGHAECLREYRWAMMRSDNSTSVPCAFIVKHSDLVAPQLDAQVLR